LIDKLFLLILTLFVYIVNIPKILSTIKFCQNKIHKTIFYFILLFGPFVKFGLASPLSWCLNWFVLQTHYSDDVNIFHNIICFCFLIHSSSINIPSGKGLDPLKHVVRGSIYNSCVWKELCWEGRTHLLYPTGSPTEISDRLIAYGGINFVPILWKQKKKIPRNKIGTDYVYHLCT
jgi:hypothetical protein